MTDSVAPMNLLELFDDIQFPATRTELVSHAEDNSASEDALDVLQALPENRYETLDALNNDLGKIGQVPGQENLWPSQQEDDLNRTQEHDITAKV